jgi:hypothetical protein
MRKAPARTGRAQGMPAPLRIAFDLDGVLADMESELVRQAEVLFGAGITGRPNRPAANADQSAPPVDENTPPLLKMNTTTGQQRQLWQHVVTIDNFWETLEEIEPGAVARLAAMAIARRWEVIFLTKRPETAGRTAQVQTQRWLTAKGFDLPSVFVVQGSRGLVAAALDLSIVVDDRPENCLDVVVDSKARAILVWRQDEKLLPAAARRLGIGAVRSIDECLRILAEIDEAPAARGGVFNRVLRLLGLKGDTLPA